MSELESLSNEEIDAEWNNEQRFNRDFALEGASPPSINSEIEKNRVFVFTHHKMGDHASPYKTVDGVDSIVEKMNDKGFEVRRTEGTIEWGDGTTRPKFYYYEKCIKIPNEIDIQKELFDHIEKELK